MADPNNAGSLPSHGESSSSTGPLAEAQSSSETDARTFIHATLSESGDEASQTSVSKPAEISVGSKLGPYLLVKKLGQGGMGAVYEARQTKLDKTFALKVLPPGFASNAAALSRFEREMKAVGKLDHPNIIKATNADEWNGTHYLVMEYIEGADLSALVKERGVLSVQDACQAIRQAALGLEHAHEHGLVHRDIKPSNLFLTNEGQVKLLDLGLARLGDHDESQSGLTSSGQLLGTPDYMAPEQWDDTHTVDARADLYSLGCTLFFLLTGKAPFDNGKQRSILHIMKAHVDAPPPDLTAACSSVPIELNAIFQRLLAKKPEDRFQTAAEVAAALEPFTQRADESRRHAPRDEPNAPSAPISNSSSSDTLLTAPSGADQSSASGARTAHHAERDGDVGRARRGSPDPAAPADRRSPRPGDSTLKDGDLRSSPGAGSGDPRTARSNVTRYLIATTLIAIAAIAGLIIKPWQNAPTVTESTSSPNPKPPTPNPSSWHGWPADAPKPAIAPFDAEQAKQHQEEWAAYLKVPVEYTNSLGMKFRLIPPGEFTMGMTKEEADAITAQYPSDEQWKTWALSSAPARRVRLTQAYYVGTYEVTQEQYEKVTGVNPSHFSATGEGKEQVKDEDPQQHPVEMVSFIDVAEFCIKLSKQETLKPVYSSANNVITQVPGDGYRLATEAEWEWSCRGGTATSWSHGEQESTLGTVAWHSATSGGRTHAVGEMKPNPFGLYDMHGNVWEWCQDWHDPQAYARRGVDPTEDPQGPEAGSARVLRGGGWDFSASGCRSAFRAAFGVESRFHADGFRVVVGVDAVRQALKVTGPALPKSAATTPSAPASDPDRAVAEWVLSLPGEGAITLEGDGKVLTRVEEIPVGAFHVKAFSIDGAAIKPKHVTDRDFALLGKVEHLTRIDIVGGPLLEITDKTIEALSTSSLAKTLQIWNCGGLNITDASIPAFNRFRKLDTLNLTGTRITDLAGLTLPELSALYLHESRVTPAGLKGLSDRCPKLATFYWGLTTGEAVDYAPIATLRLKDLSHNALKMTNDGLRSVSQISSLETLELNGSFDDEGVKHLKTLVNLRYLQLHDTPQITDAACDSLARLPKLQELRLGNPGHVSDAGVAHLSANTSLKALTLVGTNITDQGLESLAKMTSLTDLKIKSNPKLTEAGVRKLQAALPKCKIVSDFEDPDRAVAEWVLSLPGEPAPAVWVAVGDQQFHVNRIDDLPKTAFHLLSIGASNPPADRFTDRELTRFGTLKHLYGFGIGGGDETFPGITDQGLEAFSRSPAAASMRALNLNGITSVTDASIAHINQLSSLTHLTLGSSQITNAGLKQLALPELLQLDLVRARITAEGLEGLAARCPKLMNLTIKQTKLGDVDLTPLRQWPLSGLYLPNTDVADSQLETVGKMTSLNNLNLGDNVSVHDVGIQHLVGLSRLSSLNLQVTSITDAGLESLAKLQSLETLSLSGCKNLTAAGVRKLQAALPKCKIGSELLDADKKPPAK